MKYKLGEILTEYTERNTNSIFQPVAVGRYGIRKREDIYKKELADDYSKNKVIRKDTLIIGMGSIQIDVGVLADDEVYSVSSGYHTFKINTKIVYSKFLEYLFSFKNPEFTKKYMIASARQGKKVDIKSLMDEILDIPNFAVQKEIILKINMIKNHIKQSENSLKYYDELVKSRFIEMFGNKDYPILFWNDVFNTTTGKLDSNAMIEGGQYPFFTCAKEVFAIDKYAFDQEALLLAGNNAAGKYDVKYYKGKFNAYQRTYVLDLKQDWSYQLFKYQLEDKLEWLREQSKGCNTRYITLKILSELQFIIPPHDQQNEFEEFCRQIDKSKFNIQQQIIYLNELLEKQMNEYFNIH